MAGPSRGRVGCRHRSQPLDPGTIVMRIRHLAAASVIALSIASALAPSSAQVVVFDPNNYAQNVLTAARALQQISNQITSLQNQTQMLINQARNLATLPFSSW